MVRSSTGSWTGAALQMHAQLLSAAAAALGVLLGAATPAEASSASASAAGLSQARVAAGLVCDVTQHGAQGDNATKDTAAIQAAIAACEGGGTVLLKAPGRYLTAPFNLTSNQILRIEHGAMLLASTDMIDYAPVTFLPSFTDSGCRYTNIIGAYNQTNITVTGGGVADGQGGGLFWPLLANGGCDPKAGCPVTPAARPGGKCFNLTGTESVPAGCLQCLRPHLLEFMHTEGIVLDDITFVDSPFWTVHLVYSSVIMVRNVTVLAPAEQGNTDGINVRET